MAAVGYCAAAAAAEPTAAGADDAGGPPPLMTVMSDEKRLIKHLLVNYERVGIVGRPVFNTSMTIRVNFGLALIQILDLDEKNQVLTTNVWSRYVSPSSSFAYSVGVLISNSEPLIFSNLLCPY